MIHYETLVLARTEITNDELTLIERQFEDATGKAQGSVTAFDRWGKYRLAYPVRKSGFGIFILVRFQVPQEGLTAVAKELNTFFRIKCSEFVMRHVTIRLDAKAPKTYVKPEPIDNRGVGNFNSFIKDNKMEGILNTPVESRKASRIETQDDVESFDDYSE